MLPPAGSWSNSCSFLLATQGQLWLGCDKRENYSCYLSGIQIASFIFKLLEEDVHMRGGRK